MCYSSSLNSGNISSHIRFGFFSLFSGQTLYDPWIYQLFNIVFSSLPIIWFGIYDKELSFNKLENGKYYYVKGMVGKSFHSKRFWKWVIYGVVQGAIICYFSYFGNESAVNSSGKINDLWSVGIK
jgi:phospholipid-transporting ATPase